MKMQESRNIDSPHKRDSGLSRRNFVLYSAAAGAGLVAIASGLKSMPNSPRAARAYGAEEPRPPSGTSRVIIARANDLYGDDQNPMKQETGWMLNAGIGSLFGVENPIDGLRTLFKPNDVVGIKVNCIAGPELSTHPQVVAAIVSELKKIPIPAENIIIWDRTSRELKRAGYTVNTTGAGIQCYGTDVIGYEDKSTSQESFSGRLSKILTRKITALINVPILKTHGGAGVTIAMKNHYGSFHNPGSHHGNMCDPYIADLNSVDEIKAKTKLVVCDATRAICNGGPGFKPGFVWRYGGLIISTDPLAVDTVGTRIIDERRTEVGLPRLAEAGRYPRHLASAAERGLGNTTMNRIDLRTVTV